MKFFFTLISVVMLILISVVLIMILSGCTFTPTTIERTYNITIYATESSDVVFTPDILADIDKEKEVETKAQTDAKVDAEATIPLTP